MDFPILVLLVGPAVLGLGALIVGILLLARGGESDVADEAGSRSSRLVPRIVAGLCFLIAFGVGSCYAVMVLG